MCVVCVCVLFLESEDGDYGVRIDASQRLRQQRLRQQSVCVCVVNFQFV